MNMYEMFTSICLFLITGFIITQICQCVAITDANNTVFDICMDKCIDGKCTLNQREVECYKLCIPLVTNNETEKIKEITNDMNVLQKRNYLKNDVK